MSPLFQRPTRILLLAASIAPASCHRSTGHADAGVAVPDAAPMDAIAAADAIDAGDRREHAATTADAAPDTPDVLRDAAIPDSPDIPAIPDIPDGPPPVCTPTTATCTGALDDDNDGLVDCADSDCDLDPSCPHAAPEGTYQTIAAYSGLGTEPYHTEFHADGTCRWNTDRVAATWNDCLWAINSTTTPATLAITDPGGAPRWSWPMTQHGDALYLARSSSTDVVLSKLTSVSDGAGGTTPVAILGPAEDGATMVLPASADYRQGLTVDLGAGESVVAVPGAGVSVTVRGPADAAGWGPVVAPPGRQLAGYDVAVTAPTAGKYLLVVAMTSFALPKLRTHRFDAQDRPRRFLFSKGSNYALGADSMFVTVTDLDGDGQRELLLTKASCQLVTLPRMGDGTLGAQRVLLGGGVCPNTPQAIASADVDENGKPDVVVLRSDGQPLLALNDGTGGFLAPQAISGSAGLWAQVALFDADGDGHLDMALWDASKIGLYHGDGRGGFSAAGTLPLTDRRWIDFLPGDIDNDGTMDLIAFIGDSSAPGFSFYAGVAGPEKKLTVTPPGAPNNIFAAEGNLVCNGARQLALTPGLRIDFFDLGTDAVLRARGGTTMLGATQVMSQFDALDVDGDGNVDLAALGSGGVTLVMRRESGWRSAEFAFPTGGNYNPRRMAIGDFTGDGCPDVAVTGGTASLGMPILPGVCPR